MSKKYPDVSVLFAKKEEWRRRMNERPLEEKFAVATQLKNLNRRVRNQEDVFTGRKVPPLLAKVGMNKAPSARQGGT